MNTPEPTTPDRQIRLDDLTLEKHAGSYPEEMREPFMWLGWFVRERCHRDIDTLVERAKAIEINIDKTNWSKILRGRWNRDKENQPLPSPIIALSKFLRYVQQLRENNRLAEMAGKVAFVMTSTAEIIFNFIDTRRAPERVNRFGVIVGYTGTQKTATLKEFSHRNNTGICVWLEMPENGSMKEFVLWLSMKYGGSHNDSYGAARRRVFETVRANRTIIIDNAQAGYKEAKGSDQPIFNFLRRLQDETNCTIILSITPEFDRKLTEAMLQGYFEQFEGRAGGRSGFLRLPDYPPEEDVVAIAEAFGLRDAEKHQDYLVKIAQERGRIRRLFEDLQQAKIQSEAAKQKLTIEHVKKVRGEE